MEKLKVIFAEINETERRLLKLLVLGSFAIVVAILSIMYFIAASKVQEEQENKEDSLANILKEDSLSLSDSARIADSIAALPELPPEEDLRAHRTLMEIYRKQNSPEKSLEHIQRLAPFLKNDIEFQTEAGLAYLHSGKPKEALEFLKNATEISPGNPDILVDYSLALFRSNHPKEAIKQLTQAKSKFSNHSRLLTTLGAMKAELDPFSTEATDLLNQVEKNDPKYAEASYQKSRQKMNQGNFGSAEKILLKLVKSHPLDSRNLGRLGICRFALGKWDEAEKNLRSAVAINEKDYNSWYTLGELYLAQANNSAQTSKVLEDRRKAFRAFASALKSDPKHVGAHYRIGLLMNGNHQYREAIRHLTRALKGNVKNVNVLVQLALAYEGVGQKNLAREKLIQALSLDPFNRVISEKLKSLEKAN